VNATVVVPQLSVAVNVGAVGTAEHSTVKKVGSVSTNVELLYLEQLPFERNVVTRIISCSPSYFIIV
jgi:hypothetical protein